MSESKKIEKLIKRAVAGDKGALAELLIAYKDKLERRIRIRVSLNPATPFTTEDVLQETYIDVFTGISTFNPDLGVSFDTWLIRIAENRLAKMIRDRSRLKRGGGQRTLDIDGSTCKQIIADLGESAETASQRMKLEELKAAVELAIASLPSPQRQVVELHYLEQRSVEEISEQLKTTKGAVRGLLYRAKKNMREMLGGSSRWFAGP